MTRINFIQINVPIETAPDYVVEGKIDVKACLESVGCNLDGVTLEIDHKLLAETNEEREFEIDDDSNIITHRIIGKLERLPKFVTVDVYLHCNEESQWGN